MRVKVLGKRECEKGREEGTKGGGKGERSDV